MTPNETFSKAVLIVLLGLVQANVLAQAHAPDSKSKLVHEFLAAFNSHDAEKMGDLVTDNVNWVSVANGAASIEVEGRSNLIAALKEYFVSCPTCRSTISKLMSSQDRVSAIEVASWQTQNGNRSQQSIAIYEFSGTQIEAVYYFPAEPVPTPAIDSNQE